MDDDDFFFFLKKKIKIAENYQDLLTGNWRENLDNGIGFSLIRASFLIPHYLFGVVLELP